MGASRNLQSARGARTAHLWVLLAYLGLSLLLTWPLAAHFGSHVPGDGIDDPSLAWNLWWIKHAFVVQPQNPFACNWIFWPVGINLAFYTLTILNGLLSIPLQSIVGIIPAYNILLLSSFTLGGYGAYLLCRDFLRGVRLGGRRPSSLILHPSSFLGGALYAFASAKLFYAALGQGNVASSQWVPFAVLYLLRLARPQGRPRDAVLAALFLVLQAYAEQTYASFLLIFAALVALWAIVRTLRAPADSGAGRDLEHQQREGFGAREARRTRSASPSTLRSSRSPALRFGASVLSFALLRVVRVPNAHPTRNGETHSAPDWPRLAGSAAIGRPTPALRGLILRFALAGLLFAAGILPFLANMLPDLRAEGDFFSSGGGFADVFSADLAGYALPTQLHPIFGSLARAFAGHAGFPIDKGQQIYIGYTALALAALALLPFSRRPKPSAQRARPYPAGPQTPGREATNDQARRSGLQPDNLRAAAAPAAIPAHAGTDDVGLQARPTDDAGQVSNERPGLQYRASGGPGRWFWAAAALLFFLLTLGPSLRLAGRDLGIPLPFALVAQLPFFKGNRYPSRYSVMLLLSLAPLVALGAARLLAWIGQAAGRRAAQSGLRRPGAPTLAAQPPSALRFTFYAIPSALLLALLLFEHLSVPLPLFDLRVPALYDRIAQQHGDFAVLELPPGWRNGARVLGKQDIVIMQEMWYQTAHGKRLLGGNTSRNPEFKFQYFAEDPTLARLIAQTNAADLPQHAALRAALAATPITAADRARAAAWAAFLHLRYVMVHRDKLPPETESTLRALLPVSLVAEDGNLALYAVADAAPPATFALNTAEGQMAEAEGWSPPRAGMNTPGQDIWPAAWAERPEVRLLLPLPAGPARLALSGQPQAASPQEITVVVDGRQVSRQTWTFGPQAGISLTVPADPARPLLSDVRLRFSEMSSVGGMPAHMRPPAPQGALPTLLVRSAGSETGDFAHIYLNGQDVSPDGRGYNLVAFDRGIEPEQMPAIGSLAVSFDTHADPAASARLAAWVAALPPGTLVLGAVRDEASLNLKPEAVQALAALGVAGDLRGHFRWGQAFIGVKGAQAGTALEAMSGILPAQVSVGTPASAPQVAAGFTRVSITAVPAR